ncbi:hypothetical protein BRETT_001684 [Brettanomyces bruxellensis]|uniref:Magnesium transporter n=1 Tax=Dekkera bruxellensis TaxID=5007 RepID=A0A871QYN2_DEKBR|nr:uncharacterized protein BRETT_001684 [Brettanomyces bruxellensis]QOU18617.1 hypothetical protein BRETT_001684 [Brettanomyces bruxellensis]
MSLESNRISNNRVSFTSDKPIGNKLTSRDEEENESAVIFDDDVVASVDGISNHGSTRKDSSLNRMKSNASKSHPLHRSSSKFSRTGSKAIKRQAENLIESGRGHRTGSILLTPANNKIRNRTRSNSSNVNNLNPPIFKSISKVSNNSQRKSPRKESVQSSNNDSSESESDVDSHASGDSQETEEDVCFPMIPKHIRVGDVDVDELEEYIQTEKIENEEILKREQAIRNSSVGLNRMMTTGSQNFSTSALKYSPKGYQLSNFSRNGLSGGGLDQNHKIGSFQIGDNVSSNSSSGNNAPASFPQVEKFYGGENGTSEPPNRFSFFNSKREETIHSPDISSLLAPGTHVLDLFEPEDSVWWLDCTCPTEDEMKVLAKAFGIHPLTAEDIRTQEAREKVELFKTYYFVCFHTFEDDNESEDFLERVNVYMVVFRQGMLTVHFSPINNPASVRRRVRQLRDYVELSSDWLCYALVDDITDGFAPVISSIEYEAEAIEDTVFFLKEKDFRAMLFRIGESRRKVMTLMRLLQGKADVIKMFAKRCQEDKKLPSVTASQPVKPRSGIALYLGDIQDHLITMFQSLLSYEKVLSRAHANYLAQLQVESFNFNNLVTDMLSKVTFLGTILVPMNLVTGLFGMNVTVPGGDVENYGWFGGILGFIIFVCIVAAGLGEWYMNRLSKKASVESTSSTRSFKIGKHRNSAVYDRRTVTSLPSKFTRYGDWH